MRDQALPVSGGAIRRDRCGRGAPRPTARASAPRPGRPSIGPRVAHDLTRVADRLQIAGDDFVERRSFRAGDLDDAVSRRASATSATMAATSSAAMGWNRPGESLTMFPSALECGDAAEEFQELGRADDGVGDAGGLDQFLLGDLGAEIAIVASGRFRRWTARHGAGRPLRPPPREGCGRRSRRIPAPPCLQMRANWRGRSPPARRPWPL
jgi:hypothetical protein